MLRTIKCVAVNKTKVVRIIFAFFPFSISRSLQCNDYRGFHQRFLSSYWCTSIRYDKLYCVLKNQLCIAYQSLYLYIFFLLCNEYGNFCQKSASIQCSFCGHIFNTLFIFSENVTTSHGYRGGYVSFAHFLLYFFTILKWNMMISRGHWNLSFSWLAFRPLLFFCVKATKCPNMCKILWLYYYRFFIYLCLFLISHNPILCQKMLSAEVICCKYLFSITDLFKCRSKQHGPRSDWSGSLI